jgi:hypothetical protein
MGLLASFLKNEKSEQPLATPATSATFRGEKSKNMPATPCDFCDSVATVATQSQGVISKSSVCPGGKVATVATVARGTNPANDSAPSLQDEVRFALDTLKAVREYHVTFRLAEGYIQIAGDRPGTTPPRVMERASKARKGIAAILLSPLRPFGYSDSQWLEAIMDAERLGYPFKGLPG